MSLSKTEKYTNLIVITAISFLFTSLITPARSDVAEFNVAIAATYPNLVSQDNAVFSDDSSGSPDVDLGDAVLPLDADPFFVGAVSAVQNKPTVGTPSVGKTSSSTVVKTSGLNGPTTADQYGSVEWQADSNTVKYSGGVRIRTTDEDTGIVTTLTAQTAEYSPDSGVFTAEGNVRLERPDGVFSGSEIAYNMQSKVGYATAAQFESDFFRLSGRRIEMQATGAMVVYDGDFTTCIHSRPDYKLRARRMTIYQNRYVSARHITFYAGRVPLITLQSFRRDLTAGGAASAITPHYSQNEGLSFRLADSPISHPHNVLDYDFHVNFIHLPIGYAAFQRDLEPTAQITHAPGSMAGMLEDPLAGTLEQLHPPSYAEYSANRYAQTIIPRTLFYTVIQNNQYEYNRQVLGLAVSRFPEIGVRFLNLLGHGPVDPKATQENPVNGMLGNAPQTVPNAPALLNITAGLGYLRDTPTNVNDGRLATRINLSSNPLTLAPRLSLRGALTNWFNVYSTGTVYEMASPETEINYIPTRTSVLSLGYRYVYNSGVTPFIFDKRDMRQEARFQYQVSGPWAFGYITKYDVETERFYDSEIAVVRNFDCMQFGLVFHTRGQSISIVFNILPPTADKDRRVALPLGGRPQ